MPTANQQRGEHPPEPTVWGGQIHMSPVWAT
jgi:hypothetical protein